MSYDPKCEDLARHFLPPTTTDRVAARLAQYVQDALESELNRIEAENSDSDGEIKRSA
jgi:hypothetical protein